MADIINVLETLLGLEAEEITYLQMLARGLVVYIATLVMIRLGEKRFLGKNTAFDTILAIVLGSVVSRAITGNAPFFPTLGVAAGLVGLHWLFATLAFHADWFGTWVKGEARVLVEQGEIRWDAMRKSNISEKELMTAVRRQVNRNSLTGVEEAHLERDGSISIVKT